MNLRPEGYSVRILVDHGNRNCWRSLFLTESLNHADGFPAVRIYEHFLSVKEFETSISLMDNFLNGQNAQNARSSDEKYVKYTFCTM